jgi:hypothetical protein
MKKIAGHVKSRFAKKAPLSGSCNDRESIGSRGLIAALVGALALLSTAGNNPEPVSGTVAPQTPREFFNAGTQKLREGKLREAEALFESALAAQNEQLQPQTMYNLGHVRYDQGIEELKQSPPVGATTARARVAAQSADDASRSADDALGGTDIQKMVDAYMRGRGVRQDVKAATAAVRRALDAHGAALTKWERADSDFKGTFEMNSADIEARDNSDAMARRIARLIDSIHELEQAATALGDKNRDLGEKLKQLRGRIPAPNMPPGAAGDDDDEDQPFGPRPGDKEGPAKEGRELSLSPEEAGWLLETYGLDSEHQLPMNQGSPGEPRDRTRPTW